MLTWRSWLQATPDEAVKLLLQPLLQQLDADMGEGAQTVSRVSCHTWELLCAVHLPSKAVPYILPRWALQ